MSLYNMVHGFNPLAGGLMYELDLDPKDVGRFRDCYLAMGEEGALEIHVYTRNGGGNRQDYEDVTQALRGHPLYLRDFDDDFDFTYATYAFQATENVKAQVASIREKHGEEALKRIFPDAPAERWTKAMEALGAKKLGE